MTEINFPSWPYYSPEEINKVLDILSSGKVNQWTGDQCKKFENEFAKWSGVKYSVAVANGTVALETALKCLDLKVGSEVIVPSKSFIATASAVVNCGLKPIFADIDMDSQNISAETIRPLISNKTKAFICVHLAGWPSEMDEIIDLAKKNNIFVIEDCAQAHGATYRTLPVGSIGHIGCWSFCQDKIISTAGEGGMITTNDEKLYKKIWSFKDHGKSYDLSLRPNKSNRFIWLHETIGTNYRMTEIQAAIGRIQLKKIYSWHKLRKKYANMIWTLALSIKGLRVPIVPEYLEHAFYKCYVFVEIEKIKPNWSRDRIIDEINKNGVPCFSGSCSEIYLENAFKKNNLSPKNRNPNAKKLGETSIVFLIHPTMEESHILIMLKVIKEIMIMAVK